MQASSNEKSKISLSTEGQPSHSSSSTNQAATGSSASQNTTEGQSVRVSSKPPTINTSDHPFFGPFNLHTKTRPVVNKEDRVNFPKNQMLPHELLTAKCMQCSAVPATKAEFVRYTQKEHIAFNCPNQCVMNMEHHKEYYRCRCNPTDYDGIFYRGDLGTRELRNNGRLHMLGYGCIPYKSFVLATKTTTQLVIDGANSLRTLAERMARMVYQYRVDTLHKLFMYAKERTGRSLSHFSDIQAELEDACSQIIDTRIIEILELHKIKPEGHPGTVRFRKFLYNLITSNALSESCVKDLIIEAELQKISTELLKNDAVQYVPSDSHMESARKFLGRCVSRLVLQLPLNTPNINPPKQTEGLPCVESDSEPDDIARQETYNRPQSSAVKKSVGEFLLSIDQGEDIEFCLYMTSSSSPDKLLLKYVGAIDIEVSCPEEFEEPYVSIMLIAKQWAGAQILLGIAQYNAFSSENAICIHNALNELNHLPANCQFYATFRKAPDLTNVAARLIDQNRLERAILACTNFMDVSLAPEGQLYSGEEENVEEWCTDVVRLNRPEPPWQTRKIVLPSHRADVHAIYHSRKLHQLIPSHRDGSLPWNPPEEFYDLITNYNRYAVSHLKRPSRLHEAQLEFLSQIADPDPVVQQKIHSGDIVGLKATPQRITAGAKMYNRLDMVLPKFRITQAYNHWPYDIAFFDELVQRNPFNLSREQLDAAKALVQPGSVVLLQGMPGTGKTKTIAAAVLMYVMSRQKNVTQKQYDEEGDFRSPLLRAHQAQTGTKHTYRGCFGTAFGRPECSDRPAANVVIVADSNEALNNLTLAFERATVELHEHISNASTEGPNCFWNNVKKKFKILRKFPRRYGNFVHKMNPVVHKFSNFGGNYVMEFQDIILLTMGHSRSFKSLCRCAPDLVVFEEASQTSFKDFLAFFGRFSSNAEDPSLNHIKKEIFAYRCCIRNILIVGDIAQLPCKIIDPTAELPLVNENGVQISMSDARKIIHEFKGLQVLQAGSLQSVVWRHLPNDRKFQLTKLFRSIGSQETLFQFTTDYFYDAHLMSSVAVKAVVPADVDPEQNTEPRAKTDECILRELLHHSFTSDFIAVNCAPPRGKIPEFQTPRMNPTEVTFILNATNKLFNAGITSIGILSFYKDQVSLLKHVFMNNSDFVHTHDPDYSFIINNIRTVDSAQGREYDFVFLSFGRRDGRLKFLYDTKNPVLKIVENGRMNVALSRQRRALIICLALNNFYANKGAADAHNRGPEFDLKKAWGNKIERGKESVFELVAFLENRHAIIDVPKEFS